MILHYDELNSWNLAICHSFAKSAIAFHTECKINILMIIGDNARLSHYYSMQKIGHSLKSSVVEYFQAE